MTVRTLPRYPPDLRARPDASVAEIAKLMLERHVNNVPICAADGRYLGVISSNAILRALVPASARADHGLDNLSFVGDARLMIAAHLEEVLAKKVIELADTATETLGLDTPMLEAVLRLSRSTVPLPVLDEQGRLMGVLSRRAVLQHLIEEAGKG